jgi:RNA polymerase sigma-70 factor (ECF subfamily)
MPLRSLREQAAVALFEGAALDSSSDDQLAQRARDGEREAFDELVRRHQGSSLQLAWKYLGDAPAAKDACQAAFLELYRSLPGYQPKGRFVFWLRRIVLNQCRMVARSAQVRTRATDGLKHEPVRAVEQPDQALIERERREAVEVALQTLSEKLREVAVLRYASGHSLEEVAEILELPVGTVKSRLFSAVAGLRAALESRHG